MIPFNEIDPDVAECLKKCGIKETDLFNHYSDLYVGCQDTIQARLVLGGKWRTMSSVFVPQQGSDMDNYTCAIDIPFAATEYDIKNRKLVH